MEVIRDYRVFVESTGSATHCLGLHPSYIKFSTAYLSKLQFLHLQHRDNSRAALIQVLWELNKIIQVKCLALCLPKKMLAFLLLQVVILLMLFSCHQSLVFVKQWFLWDLQRYRSGFTPSWSDLRLFYNFFLISVVLLTLRFQAVSHYSCQPAYYLHSASNLQYSQACEKHAWNKIHTIKLFSNCSNSLGH